MGSLKEETVDVLIVGAGFSGIYELYLARKAGFNAKVVDRASDAGGTWYWNRYPGAMSDTEAHVYRYSWDKELLQTWNFEDHYVKQPESLAYLRYVVEKHDLRRNMEFDVHVISTTWNEGEQKWYTNTSQGLFISTFLVTALGLLTTPNWPEIDGLHSFKGEMYHTARFPHKWDFTGKRVGVIGSGSTGVQVITQLGKEKKVKSLISFQRSPQYSVPSGDRRVTQEEREAINGSYDAIWYQVRHSQVGFGFAENDIPAMSVSAEEREKRFQASWDKGNGFRFLYTFGDVMTNLEANLAACDFIKRKIKQTVVDPEKSRKLMPSELYARRPLCDGGYYQVFNEDFADVVNLQETPIQCITEKGIKTSDRELEFDVIIIATGFDGVDGSYKSIQFEGQNGDILSKHWSTRPKSYLGMMITNFPNLFMIAGPLGPISNQPPGSELQCELVTQLLIKAKAGNTLVEATQEAEDEWVRLCDESTEGSLMKTGKSWLFGHNVPGKHHETIYYFHGLQAYRGKVHEAFDAGYKGFMFKPRSDARKQGLPTVSTACIAVSSN